MEINRLITSTENSLLELPRNTPPCGMNLKQVRFSGPAPSGDLDLSLLESPRVPPQFQAIPPRPTLVQSSCQTEVSRSTVDRACQTDEEKPVQNPAAMNDLMSMIQNQDKRMDSLHEKLELILTRIDEKRCSCAGTQLETDDNALSPPALDNVLGQVEIMLNSPRPTLQHATIAMHNASSSLRVDQSAAFDALAMKYLRGDELGRITNPPRETDVSLATTAYLQRHHLPR